MRIVLRRASSFFSTKRSLWQALTPCACFLLLACAVHPPQEEQHRERKIALRRSCLTEAEHLGNGEKARKSFGRAAATYDREQTSRLKTLCWEMLDAYDRRMAEAK